MKKYIYEIEWLNNRIKGLEEEKDFFYRSAQQFRNENEELKEEVKKWRAIADENEIMLEDRKKVHKENEELKKRLDKSRTDNIYEE